jgi:hypothetical protein
MYPRPGVEKWVKRKEKKTSKKMREEEGRKELHSIYNISRPEFQLKEGLKLG